jgi:hypothetical protein
MAAAVADSMQSRRLSQTANRRLLFEIVNSIPVCNSQTSINPGVHCPALGLVLVLVLVLAGSNSTSTS